MFADAEVKGAALTTRLGRRPGLGEWLFFVIRLWFKPDGEKHVTPACKPNIRWEFERIYTKAHQERGWALSGQVMSNSCSVVPSKIESIQGVEGVAVKGLDSKKVNKS